MMEKRFLGTEFFTGNKFVIPGIDARKDLARDIAHINEDERDLLKRDFENMDPSDIYNFISAMAVVRRLPCLVSIAADSMEHSKKPFSHDQTMRLIRLALSYDEDRDYDMAQARLDIASLIRSQKGETKLSMLASLSKLPDESKSIIYGSKEIDEAVSDNLMISSSCCAENKTLEDITRALSQIKLPKSLLTLMRILKADGMTNGMNNVIQDLYLSNSIDQEYFNSIREVAGNTPLIKISRIYLNVNKGKESKKTIHKNYPESFTITEEDLADSLLRTVSLGKPCAFFEDLIAGHLHPNDYKMSCLYIMDNFAKIANSDVRSIGVAFSRFAISMEKSNELVYGLSTLYGGRCANHAESIEYNDFDFRSANLIQILNELHESRYANEIQFGIIKKSLTELIAGSGLVSHEDIINNISEKFAQQLARYIDIMPNKDEVLRKCMNVRKHAFSNDLGL